MGGPQRFPASAEDDHDNGQPATCSSSRSTRNAMVNHLKSTHGVYDIGDAIKMADQFREPSQKAFWSCGFCICHFGSLNERLNHVRNHFKEYPTPDQWHLTNEILGLIGQPKVVQIWAQLQEARHVKHRVDATWQESEETNMLKHKLQMGASDASSAQRLAEEAYAVSSLAQTPAILNLPSSSHSNPMHITNEHETQAAALPTTTEEELSGFGGGLSMPGDDRSDPHTSGAFTYFNDIGPSLDPMLFPGSSPKLDDFDGWNWD